jgi:hypothetical protein
MTRQQVFCEWLLMSHYGGQWEVFLFGDIFPRAQRCSSLVPHVARSDWTQPSAIIWSSLSLLATFAYINGVLIWLLLPPSTHL